jgi:hypothetical protein
VTHRAFCDALAQENNKLARPMNMATVASALQGHAHHLALPPPPSHADDLDDAAEDDPDADADFTLDTKMSPQLRLLPATMQIDSPPPLLPPLSMAGCMLSSLAAARPSPSTTPFLSGAKTGLDGPSEGFSPAGSAASMSATALLQKAAEMGATTSGGGYGGGGAGFSTTVGFGPMLCGPDRFPTMSPFGPLKAPIVEPYDGLPLGHTQMVGLLPMPGQQQLYGGHGGGGGVVVGSMTRAIGSLMHGGQQQQQQQMVEHRRPDDLRVVDYLGVDDQQSFSGVGPFGPHMGPWT